MVSIEETADNMNLLQLRNVQSALGNIQTMLSVFREMKMIMDMQSKSISNDIFESTPSNYSYTGQHTDIAFVDEKGTINIEDIKHISNQDLKNNVMRNYYDAVKDGYLNLENNQFTLTDKGREHINSQSFIEQFRKDQLQAFSKDKAQINLRGNQSDLNVFRYCDSINLNRLSYSDPAQFKRVLSYFEECQKYNFVKISADGTVTPTEKCYKFFEQNKSFDFDIKPVTPDNIEQVTKKLSNEAAKKSAQEATKKAVREGVKQATTQAAKATVATASGAATAGIGTAVTAVVDLSVKGVKAISKNTKFQQTAPTAHKR